MGLIDLVIIVLVGAFVVSRFIKFDLPRDDREQGKGEGQRAEDWRKLLSRKVEPAKPAATSAARMRPAKAKPVLVDVTGLSGIDQVKALDAGFDEGRFLDGTSKAYDYFYDRWNAADEEGLANLCAPQLLNQLSSQLEAYAERGEQPHVAVESVLEKDIVDARVSGRTAIVDVEFVARQAVDGGPVHDVRSRWTFARPLNSDDPNWEVQQVLELGGRA